MLKKTILWLDEITKSEESFLGGKITSLYKILPLSKSNSNIKIPKSFIINIDEFYNFLLYNNIYTKIQILLKNIVHNDINNINKISIEIQKLIAKSQFSLNIKNEIEKNYIKLKNKTNSIAVRSSSCDEDSCENSFAGQQNSYLNIIDFNDLLIKIKLVYASLYGPHAISYRISKKICLLKSKMAICIQEMIRSDKGISGVMFTEDPHSKNHNFISISANYGLGESIVQGTSNPDEYIVFKKNNAIIQKNIGCKNHKVIYNKSGGTISVQTRSKETNIFCLSDEQISTLSTIGKDIENFFGYSTDIEWAFDAIKKTFYILQIRAITTKKISDYHYYNFYKINQEIKNKIILTGKAIGKKVATGKIKIIHKLEDINTINNGDILVTNITDPQWEPAMKKAAGIITNLGGRTCHAAIIARELEIPAIVGTNIATKILKESQEITLVCCEGDIGYICAGHIPFTIEQRSTKNIFSQINNTKIMLNIGNPSIAFETAMLPSNGVGLTRMEYIINNCIGIHPLAAIHHNTLPKKIKTAINKKITGYKNANDFFLKKLIDGLGTIASAFYPRPVTIRLSDFKTNEYRNLLGGSEYENFEENPMIGYRGAMRYLSNEYQDAFLLEIKALLHLINIIGLQNIAILIPFVRTPEEAQKIINFLSDHGLNRSDSLKIYIMCEIPSNVILAESFLQICDGFSIGSNDLTQLILGIDRDGNQQIQSFFDENNDAVKKMIETAINEAKKQNKYIGICGQASSDNIHFASWLINQNIDSISLVPDSLFQFYDFFNTNKNYIAKNNILNYNNENTPN